MLHPIGERSENAHAQGVAFSLPAISVRDLGMLIALLMPQAFAPTFPAHCV